MNKQSQQDFCLLHNDIKLDGVLAVVAADVVSLSALFNAAAAAVAASACSSNNNKNNNFELLLPVSYYPPITHSDPDPYRIFNCWFVWCFSFFFCLCFHDNNVVLLPSMLSVGR